MTKDVERLRAELSNGNRLSSPLQNRRIRVCKGGDRFSIASVLERMVCAGIKVKCPKAPYPGIAMNDLTVPSGNVKPIF